MSRGSWAVRRGRGVYLNTGGAAALADVLRRCAMAGFAASIDGVPFCTGLMRRTVAEYGERLDKPATAIRPCGWSSWSQIGRAYVRTPDTNAHIGSGVSP